MASLSAIRDAIKATIENNIADISGYDTVPDASNLPAFVVVPDTADFDVAMGRGLDTYDFDLYVLVSVNEMDLRQDELDTYVTGAGSKSIRQVVFQNKTLGLTNTNAHVTGMTSYGDKFSMSDLQHIGAVLHITVHTKGTE